MKCSVTVCLVGTLVLKGVAAISAPVGIHVGVEHDRNLLRNGSFEFANRYNGMSTILDQGDVLVSTWGRGEHKVWCDLGLEQWQGEGATNRALFASVPDAFSGTNALAVTAPGVATTWLAYAGSRAQPGTASVTLSWRVKGRAGASAKVSLALHEGAAPLSQEPRLHADERVIDVRPDVWTRGSFTFEIPEAHRRPTRPAFHVRLAATAGTVVFDDVQLEYGPATTAFTEQQSHFLSLEIAGCNPQELPKFRKGTTRRTNLLVRNTSGKILSGELELFLDAWNAAGKTRVAKVRCIDWKPGEAKTFPLEPGELEPDAYIVVASFAPYFDATGVFTTENTGWGTVGRSTLLKRNGLRFAVFPATLPQDLFGVGNGMIGHAGWWSGNTFENAVRGKSVHPVLLGEADPYKAALIGAPNILETGFNYDFPEDVPEARNPASPHQVNAYSPAGRKAIHDSAIRFATRVADDPSVAGAKLENEAFFVNRSDFCPDKWADLDYRNWLKRRYRNDLAQLNAAWKTEYAAWDEIQQPISGVKEGTIQKTGGAAIDWTASMGKMTQEAEARLAANPAAALDWFRWRAYSVVKVYGDYIVAAKTVDTKTLYGNNYPWPNFFAHVVWPQWRTHDVIMLDQQYVCGFPRTLGTNEEMIDILEQAESIARGERPIWGREIYFQPNYPGEMAALQNWAMIAHGMSVPMTFAWRPYADYNQEIFRTGNKSWLKEDAPPMWFLLDTDGTPVPGYDGNLRSTEEIAAFHRTYDGRSLRRIRGDVAIYYSTDTSADIMRETFDKPYESARSRNRTAVAAALRYAGVRIEYFDDATLAEVDPKTFPCLLAIGESVISDAAEKLLRRYAEQGGRLVVFNDFNTYDANLNAKPKGGVETWTGDVRAIRNFVGKYNVKPHMTAEYEATIGKVLAKADLPRHAWWENETLHQKGEEALLPGEGRPLVEVVARRQEKTGRLFVFVLNKGGAGRGRLCGGDFDGRGFVDALTGVPVSRTFDFPAFGYRVLVSSDHVSAKRGEPAILPPGKAYAEPKRAYAAGPSLALAPNGRLWATWHAGMTAGEDKNGYIVLATSADDGVTWTDVAVADPDGDGPRAMSDPQVWVDPDRHLRWSFSERLREGKDAAEYADMKGRTCLLGMVTFPDANIVPEQLPRARCLGRGVMMGKPSVLSDGSWLLPVARWWQPNSSGVMVSSDRGVTWTWRGGATLPPDDRCFDEHSVVEAKNGDLHCYSRSNNDMFHARSVDRGRTWTECPGARLRQPSARFLVRRLASGRWLMVKHGGFDRRIGRSHLTAFISEDEGCTWKGGLLLDARTNVSYPDCDQRADGLVYVIYDFERTSAKEVSFATFTEDDVLAGRDVSGRLRLRRRICGSAR